MAFAYLGLSVPYDQLLKLLKIRSFGAAGQNLKYLAALDVQVIYREGSLDELKGHLLNGRPCITLVRTADTIYVNDPAFETSPLALPVSDFELAWMFFDYRYGMVMR